MARRQNAYSQLIQEGKKAIERVVHKDAENGDAVKPQSGNTSAEEPNTTKQQKSAKITIYPNQDQLNKLYDFMEAYRHKTGVKINQQDMIRRIIDVADVNTVLP